VLTEGARKIYQGRHGARGRRVGQGWSRHLCLVQTKSATIANQKPRYFSIKIATLTEAVRFHSL
jgi:hypothetical protein